MMSVPTARDEAYWEPDLSSLDEAVAGLVAATEETYDAEFLADTERAVPRLLANGVETQTATVAIEERLLDTCHLDIWTDDTSVCAHLLPEERRHLARLLWPGVEREEEDRLQTCAALAYLVVDSGLDSGRVRQGPLTALAVHVAAMLDAGDDLATWAAALERDEEAPPDARCA